MRRLLVAIALFAFAIAGVGCAKPKVELAVASQANVNPDHSGRPSPVILKMYELSSNTAFMQGDFIALFETPVQTLGADLIAADELVFVPGEARVVVYEPKEKTQYIGILLGFRQLERANWRTIQAVNPTKENRLCIELTDTSVLLINDEKAEDWDPVEVVRRYQQGLAHPVTPGTPAPGGPGGLPQASPGGSSQGYVLPTAQRI
jgi:type VI secretion system protein VasD